MIDVEAHTVPTKIIRSTS